MPAARHRAARSRIVRASPPPSAAARPPNARDRPARRATAGRGSRRPGSAATPLIIATVSRAVRIDAAAMEADVHLDEHVDLPAGAHHRLGPLLRDGRMIDDEREARAIEQRDHAIGVGGIQRIGQADVGDAAAANTSASPSLAQQMPIGAAIDLPARDHAGSCGSWCAAAAGCRAHSAAACMRSRLRCARARSIRTAGVASPSTVMTRPAPAAAITVATSSSRPRAPARGRRSSRPRGRSWLRGRRTRRPARPAPSRGTPARR